MKNLWIKFLIWFEPTFRKYGIIYAGPTFKVKPGRLPYKGNYEWSDKNPLKAKAVSAWHRGYTSDHYNKMSLNRLTK